VSRVRACRCSGAPRLCWRQQRVQTAANQLYGVGRSAGLRVSKEQFELVAVHAARGAPLPLQLVPNAIEHGLPKVCLKRARTTDFEILDLRKRAKEGVLDKVVGVCQIAGPAGQTTAHPAAERLDMARQQAVQGFLVAATDPFD
jgi:hypothetical protein